MSEENYFRFSNSVLLAPMFAVLLIWTVFWIEIRFQVNLNTLGIYPRTISGLKGVLFSPLVHGSLDHLYNNTIPIAVLTAALFYFYRGISLKVLIFGILLSGLLTWIIGRPSYHIGASGLIYVLASFIFFKGVFTKHFRLIALSLGVVFIYGSMLWYMFPIKDGISWEGHLSGFVAGLFLATVLKTRIPEARKFEWEKEDFNEAEDEFLKHFDEDGNFIENKMDKDKETIVNIRYHYKKDQNQPGQ